MTTLTRTDLIYPKEMIGRSKANRPNPTWVESKQVFDASCNNCGGRGFMVAFYCDYDRSLIAGRGTPSLENGKSLRWINNAWWVGEHETYDCPVCFGRNGRV